jgi:fucose permease
MKNNEYQRTKTNRYKAVGTTFGAKLIGTPIILTTQPTDFVLEVLALALALVFVTTIATTLVIAVLILLKVFFFNLIVYAIVSTLCTVCVGSHSREKTSISVVACVFVVACVLVVG